MNGTSPQSERGTAITTISKLSKNLFSTASSKALVAISNLLLVPLFLHYWSPIRYGEWLTIYSFVAYLASADFGMTTAAINELTQRYCKGDHEGFVTLLHTALCVYVAAASVVTILAFASLAYLPLEKMGVHRYSPEIGLAAALLVTQTAWIFPGFLVFNFYRTVGTFYRSQWLSNLYQLLLVVVTVFGLAAGAGFVGIAAIQLGLLLGMTAVLAVLINLRYPSLALGFRGYSQKEIRPLLVTGSSFAVMTIGNTISLQGPILVISLTLGPLFVAAFSTARTLANSVRQLVGVFTSAAWPELTLVQASHNQELARRFHRGLVIATTAISAAAAASLWVVGPQVIDLWTHAHLPATVPLIRLFAIQVALQAPWIASSCVSESANKNRLLSILYIGSSVTGVLLSALTIRQFGVVAVPVSIVIGEMCICAHLVIRNSCMLIGEDYKAFAIQLWTRFLLLAAVASGMAALVSLFPIHSAIFRSLAISSATTLAVSAAAWFCWLNRQEREGISEQLLRIVPKRARYMLVIKP